MAQNSEKAPKKSVFKTLKAEFKKIVWPSTETVRKETIAVAVSTVVFGAIIAVLDAVIKIGIDFIAGIGV
jgi:preprotein translocase subunit SecE